MTLATIRRRATALSVLAFGLAAAQPAAAQVTLDFNGAPMPSSVNLLGDGHTYLEDGYVFTSLNGVLSTLGPAYPTYSGSPVVFDNRVGGVIRLARQDGGLFDFHSVRIGNLNVRTGLVDVTFIGRLADMSVVTQSFTESSVAGLQTFTLNSAFTGLTSVEFDQSGGAYEQYDDFVVSGTTHSVTPEPGTWALMGTGLLGLVGAARRKRAAV